MKQITQMPENWWRVLEAASSLQTQIFTANIIRTQFEKRGTTQPRSTFQKWLLRLAEHGLIEQEGKAVGQAESRWVVSAEGKKALKEFDHSNPKAHYLNRFYKYTPPADVNKDASEVRRMFLCGGVAG